MTGYIGVFTSGFVDVTKDTGEFEIRGLPPGTYTLTAWHERYGELKQTVTVGTGAVESNFTYAPPK
jgi:hypothetical protein